MRETLVCPHCGGVVMAFRNPFPTVDIIIRVRQGDDGEGIVLVRRRDFPVGWALPGGFVDYGESLEEAAVREAMEETGLKVSELRQFHAYSDPCRDPRQHNISIVFLARADGGPKAGDDASDCRVFCLDALPRDMVFDHQEILRDYERMLRTGRCP
ncbi:MAG: NUDIX domain-containing protein [Thermodesulfobacteriota bacterium]